MKLKNYLITLLTLGSIHMATAQSQGVSYDYDYAGNRISRKIITLPQSVKGKTPDPVPVTDQMGDRKITIYPNPTKGMLAVDINGGDSKDELSIQLYDGNGKQMLNEKVQPGTTTLNLTSYPQAYYIMRVQAGSKFTEYKIIKQ